MAKRAVLYARTNDGNKSKLALQLQVCRECARDNGWQVVAELAEEGVSGLSDETPQLDGAMEMAHAGEFDVLIVREPNRISRDLMRLLTITAELERVGIQIQYALDLRHAGDADAAVAALMDQFLVYARVSDDPPGGDGPNLAHQVAALRAYALRSILSQDRAR